MDEHPGRGASGGTSRQPESGSRCARRTAHRRTAEPADQRYVFPSSSSSSTTSASASRPSSGLTAATPWHCSSSTLRMTMKELGQRMGCDPSFITTIADSLEKHGLARREPSLRDRRSKNIVLTPEGVTVRDTDLPRAHDPGAVVYRAGYRRAPVPARADAEDAPIAWREVMLSQPRRFCLVMCDETKTAGSSSPEDDDHTGKERLQRGTGASAVRTKKALAAKYSA